jgi:hypothetical protein
MEPKKTSIAHYNLEKMRLELGFTQSEWARRLGITGNEYGEVLFHHNIDKTFNAVVSASSIYNLTPEQFYAKQGIDIRTVLARTSGDHMYVPEKYTVGAFSKRRSANAMLDFAARIKGEHLKVYTLRELQLSKQALDLLDAPINIDCMVDILNSLVRNGLPREEVPLMGVESVQLFRKSALGQELKALKHPREVFEHMIVDLAHYYEKNSVYYLHSLTDESCVIESMHSEHVCDLLKRKTIGSPEVCLMRKGIFQATPLYIGLPFATVVETKCIHVGDPLCRFEVDFSHAAHVAMH